MAPKVNCLRCVPLEENPASEKQSHCRGVLVFTIDLNSTALDAFELETHPAIETQRLLVVGPRLELHSRDAHLASDGHAAFEQALTKALAAKLRQDAHSKRAAVAKRVVPTRLNIAPPNQAAFGLGDHSWNSISQPFGDELLHVLKGRGFQRREEPALTSDAIQALPKRKGVRLEYWCDFNMHAALTLELGGGVAVRLNEKSDGCEEVCLGEAVGLDERRAMSNRPP